MARKLKGTVYVDGVAYRAGTEEGDLPDGGKQVTNPKAWSEPERKSRSGDGEKGGK